MSESPQLRFSFVKNGDFCPRLDTASGKSGPDWLPRMMQALYFFRNHHAVPSVMVSPSCSYCSVGHCWSDQLHCLGYHWCCWPGLNVWEYSSCCCFYRVWSCPCWQIELVLSMVIRICARSTGSGRLYLLALMKFNHSDSSFGSLGWNACASHASRLASCCLSSRQWGSSRLGQ